jgi:hypothetical protein
MWYSINPLGLQVRSPSHELEKARTPPAPCPGFQILLGIQRGDFLRRRGYNELVDRRAIPFGERLDSLVNRERGNRKLIVLIRSPPSG